MEHRLSRFLIAPLILVVPPTMVLLAVEEQMVADKIGALAGHSVAKFLQDSALIVIVGVFLYRALLGLVGDLIRSSASNIRSLGSDDLLALLEVFDRVVEAKSRRFAKAVSENVKDPIDGETVFNTITQPDQQLALLVDGIHGVFSRLVDSPEMTIGLLRIRDEEVTGWEYFCPYVNRPRTPAAKLNDPRSTVKQAVVQKAPVIIEDIAKELAKPVGRCRFWRSEFGPDTGSQFSYPLRHPDGGQVLYVVSIYSSSPNDFLKHELRLYDWFMKQFERRMVLESSLRDLKETTGDSKASQEQSSA